MTYEVPNEAITKGPTVMWNHIDGPLLEWAGRMHWLTWRERLAIWLRIASVDDIACRLWPGLARTRLQLFLADA